MNMKQQDEQDNIRRSLRPKECYMKVSGKTGGKEGKGFS